MTTIENPVWLGEYIWEETSFDGSEPKCGPLPDEVLSMFRPQHCLLCNIKTANMHVAYAHYESKGHFKKVAHYMKFNYNAIGTLRSKEGKFEPVTCDICNIELMSRIVYLQHYEGKQHAKNLKKKALQIPIKLFPTEAVNPPLPEPPAPTAALAPALAEGDDPLNVPPPPPLPKLGSYVCALCDVTTATRAQMEAHNNGARHLKNVAKLADGELREYYMRNGNCEPVETPAVEPATTTAAPSADPAAAAAYPQGWQMQYPQYGSYPYPYDYNTWSQMYNNYAMYQNQYAWQQYASQYNQYQAATAAAAPTEQPAVSVNGSEAPPATTSAPAEPPEDSSDPVIDSTIFRKYSGRQTVRTPPKASEVRETPVPDGFEVKPLSVFPSLKLMMEEKQQKSGDDADNGEVLPEDGSVPKEEVVNKEEIVSGGVQSTSDGVEGAPPPGVKPLSEPVPSAGVTAVVEIPDDSQSSNEPPTADNSVLDEKPEVEEADFKINRNSLSIPLLGEIPADIKISDELVSHYGDLPNIETQEPFPFNRVGSAEPPPPGCSEELPVKAAETVPTSTATTEVNYAPTVSAPPAPYYPSAAAPAPVPNYYPQMAYYPNAYGMPCYNYPMGTVPYGVSPQGGTSYAAPVVTAASYPAPAVTAHTSMSYPAPAVTAHTAASYPPPVVTAHIATSYPPPAVTAHTAASYVAPAVTADTAVSHSAPVVTAKIEASYSAPAVTAETSVSHTSSPVVTAKTSPNQSSSTTHSALLVSSQITRTSEQPPLPDTTENPPPPPESGNEQALPPEPALDSYGSTDAPGETTEQADKDLDKLGNKPKLNSFFARAAVKMIKEKKFQQDNPSSATTSSDKVEALDPKSNDAMLKGTKGKISIPTIKGTSIESMHTVSVTTSVKGVETPVKSDVESSRSPDKVKRKSYRRSRSKSSSSSRSQTPPRRRRRRSSSRSLSPDRRHEDQRGRYGGFRGHMGYGRRGRGYFRRGGFRRDWDNYRHDRRYDERDRDEFGRERSWKKDERDRRRRRRRSRSRSSSASPPKDVGYWEMKTRVKDLLSPEGSKDSKPSKEAHSPKSAPPPVVEETKQEMSEEEVRPEPESQRELSQSRWIEQRESSPEGMNTDEEEREKREILEKVAIIKRKLMEQDEGEEPQEEEDTPVKAKKHKKDKSKKKKKKKKRSSSTSSGSSSDSSSSSASSSSSSSSSSASSSSEPKSKRLVDALMAQLSGRAEDKTRRRSSKKSKNPKKRDSSKKKKKKDKKRKKDKKKKKEEPESLSSYVTSNGLYHCKFCNFTSVSGGSFLEHLISEEHKLILNLLKNKIKQ